MSLKFEVGDLLTDCGVGLDKQSLARSCFIRRSAGRNERYIPTFASNALQLRAVARQVTHVLIANGAMCKISDFRVVDEKATKAILSGRRLPGGWKSENLAELATCVRRARTYTGTVLHVLWGCWRMRWNNRDVANELGLSIHRIQTILRCAVHAAWRLGLPTYPGRKPYIARNGHKETWTAEKRARKAESVRAYFSDPANRAKTSAATKAAMQRPAIKERIKPRNWTPEERAAQAARIRAYYQNPARRIAHGVATRAGMSSPAVRAKLKKKKPRLVAPACEIKSPSLVMSDPQGQPGCNPE